MNTLNIYIDIDILLMASKILDTLILNPLHMLEVLSQANNCIPNSVRSLFWKLIKKDAKPLTI